MASNKTRSPPRFLQRSRSVTTTTAAAAATPRLCHPRAPEPAPLSTNLPGGRSRSSTKPRPSSVSDVRRPPKENRESTSPRKPIVLDTSRSTRSAGASAWALSPGRTPVAPVAKEGKRRGRLMGFFKQRKEPSAKEEAVHQLKMLTTRLAQWRFVNARAEAAVEATSASAEQKLFYTWLRINELQNLVAAKTVLYQRRKLKMKLIRMLNPQTRYLFQCESLSTRHLEAVTELSRVMGAMCISLPVLDGVQINMLAVNDHFRMAMDTIREIEATVGLFFTKVENISSLLYEMVNIMRQERECLEELVKTSKIITSMEMHEISLRANLIQAMKKGINIHINRV